MGLLLNKVLQRIYLFLLFASLIYWSNAIDIDGGEVVIFAGAPLSGFKKIVQNKIRVPIIDCAEAAVKQAELAVAMNKNIINNNKLPPKISIGIDKNLSELISHKTNNG